MEKELETNYGEPVLVTADTPGDNDDVCFWSLIDGHTAYHWFSPGKARDLANALLAAAMEAEE